MNKDLLESKTAIGIAVAVLTPILSKYGIEPGMVADLVALVGAGVGGLLGLYGRHTAAGPISSIAGIQLRK